MDTPIIRSGQQDIKYTGTDTEFSAEITAENVVVHCNNGKHSHGSNKMKLINRIDYNWEFKYYLGQLIAVHINGKVVAYGMKGKDGGMIRVTNQETGQRTLIKNRKREVKDISFAFSRQQIILGYVDDEGSVWINEILDSKDSITYNQLLHIYHRPSDTTNIPNYRLIWCPYLSCFDEEDADSLDDPEKMFVVLNGSKAEVWNYGIINMKYGNGPIEPNEDYRGYVEINHNDDLVDASFSSDGTAIAVASEDGYVKFFQVYMIENEKQKCLHEWVPHEGKPLSSIIFVDNLLECSSQCWKFTITGANHNSELKLWSCETWTCLQTIHFKAHPECLPMNYLKIAIDYSGKFLILSDINNRALYVMNLKRDEKAQIIAVTMLSQFLLSKAFLSYHITEADIKKLKSNELNTNDDYCIDLLDQDDDDDDDIDNDDNDNNIGVVIKMLVIQQKKFQECNIVFQPDTMLIKTTNYNNCTTSNNNNNNNSHENGIIEKIPKLDDLQTSVTLLIQQTQQSQLGLTTTTTNNNNNNNNNNIDNNVVVTSSSINKNDINNHHHHKNNTPDINNDIEYERPEKDNFINSGGSSPSREVQEILSLNNSTTQDFYDNLTTKLVNDDDDDDDEEEDEEEEDLTQKNYKQQQQQDEEETENLLFNDNSSKNNEMIWPKIPLVKDNEIIKDEKLRQELQLGGGDDIANDNNEWTKLNLNTINNKIKKLETTIKLQNIVLKKIQHDLTTTNNNKDEFIKELDLAMSKQQLHIAKMLENLINMQKNNERQQQENLLTDITQIINKVFNDKIQNSITNEMKNLVLPTIINFADTLKHHMDLQSSQKINSDIILQDKISKLINSKTLAESLSTSVANVISPILENCYKEMISSSLIPSWEKICGNMFHQINETFTQGTKEYTASVEQYMERQRRVQEKGKDLIVQMQLVSETLQHNTEKLTGILTSEIHKQFNVTFKLMQEVMTHNIKEIVSEQIKLGFKNHASVIEGSVINAVRSRAVTPSPHSDSHVTLSMLDHSLSRENYEEAFKLALTAGNLSFVIYVCERVDVNVLFGEKTPPQNCILSFIQQLSVHLAKNTELKLSYLRAALTALIPDDPNTKQFGPKVLKDLLGQLNSFMSSNPRSKFIYEAKLLKMAAESMLMDK